MENEPDEFEGIEAMSRRARILLPLSAFRRYWVQWIITLTIYNVIAIPLELCFGYTVPLPLRVWDIFVSTNLIIDMVLSARTAYQRPDGSLEISPGRVWRHYILTNFVIAPCIKWLITCEALHTLGKSYTAWEHISVHNRAP